jgi:hypothetical protein
MTASARALTAALAIFATGTPSLAQSVTLLGEFRSWGAYAASESTGPVCFAMSKSTSVDPMPDGFTSAYLYLTHRPSVSVRNEMNVVSGYMFAPDTPATATVGGQTFELFTERDAAWLLDPSQNDNLAGALRAGSSVVIEGTSDKGIKITETFSLSGATAASRAIEGNCTG